MFLQSFVRKQLTTSNNKSEVDDRLLLDGSRCNFEIKKTVES